MSEHQLHLSLEEDRRFACTACGRCCAERWGVPVRPKLVESIKASETYLSRTRQGIVPLVVIDGQHYTARKEDGSCTFLANEGCDLHRERGATGKPRTCRLYPFNLIHTPGGYFVSLSYSCPAALAGVGPSLEESRADIEELIQELEAGPSIAAPRLGDVALTDDNRLSWEGYLILERAILRIIRREDPIGSLLNAACRILQRLTTAESFEVDDDFGEPSPLLQDAFDVLPMFVNSCVESCGQRSSYEYGHLTPRDLISQDVIGRYLRNLIVGKRLLGGPTIVGRLLALACGLTALIQELMDSAAATDSRHFSFAHLDKAFEWLEVSIITHNQDLNPFFLEYEAVLGRYCAIPGLFDK